MDNLSIFLAIFVILLIVILIYFEYLSHDCLNGKNCRTKVYDVYCENEPLEKRISQIRKMVKNIGNYVVWRLALIGSLIVVFPIIWYFFERLPKPSEYIIVSGLIFLAIYFSFSWIWAHFFYPNLLKLEEHLTKCEHFLLSK
jgi:hypothetical protein